ncbi:MAG TPA: MarR family transcriptional regulator [Acetobacteraceae bacterium]|jgi:DNA-binding MarR family transcriptional regulator
MKTKSGRTRRETPAGNGEAFKLENFLPYRLSVAANRVSRLFARRYFEAFGLSIPEWRVLAIVGRLGTLSPSAVGEATAMDKVKVSRAAASLVARGLARQTQDPQDGRGRLLSLTRRGVAVYQGMVPLACELEGQLAEGLSRSEWSVLLKALDKLSLYAKGARGGDGHGASVN